ncbi:MAG: LPS assembly lipoprotein LptE [Niabella sp.]
MTLKIYKKPFALIAAICIFLLGCGIYRFNDTDIPPEVKIVKVNYVQNKARYINPTLAAELTDKLRQKIVSQTRLKQTNGDDADWVINPTITNYSMSTSGISNQQVNSNRLNVGISIEVIDSTQKPKKYDVTRSFDYPGSMTLQQAESQLKDEMLRSLTDDMFNRIFSNW